MGYSNGIVSAPVSVYDIRSAVSHSSGDLGTLIMNGAINMWAKWKPVRKAIIDTTPQLASDLTWKPDDQLTDPWWRANGNYGLTYTGFAINLGQTGVVDALTNMLSVIDGGLNGWGYERPIGGSSSPFRAIDFNRYNKNAPNPISQFTVAPTTVEAADLAHWEISAQFIETEVDRPIRNRDYLVPSDITNVTLYSGIVLFKKVGSTYSPIAWCTGNAWMGNGIKAGGMSDGIIGYGDTQVETRIVGGNTYYVLPVFFTCELAQSGAGFSSNPTIGSQRVIPVPYTNFQPFNAVHASTSQRIGLPVASPKKILALQGASVGSYNGNVYLDSTGSYYIGGTANVTVGLVNNTWNGAIPPSQGQYAFWQDFLNVSVGSEERKLVTSITANNLSLSMTWKIVVIVDGSKTEIGLLNPAQT